MGWQERKEFISNIFANKNDHEEDLFGENCVFGNLIGWIWDLTIVKERTLGVHYVLFIS